MAIISDIVIVGGGHAGVEAAIASAKFGLSVILVTHSADTIGRMSCNPAVGGIAKSRVVREVDALGGIIGICADKTAIQYRILNRRKGPAVQATRCQSDRNEYEKCVQKIIRTTPQIRIIEGSAQKLLCEGKKICGVALSDGTEIFATATILATGTFLGGKIFIGEKEISGGRIDEAPEYGLSDSLRQIGIKLLRFKTGTPPRISGRTIDFGKVRPQHGEEDYVPFSFNTDDALKLQDQRECYITHTTSKTHELIINNLKKSALYGGKITGIGPRYCPSIEVKVERFQHHPRHIVFLEPEGKDSDEYYPNGLSNSLPEDIQVAMLGTIPGLEKAEIIRPGYAVEYDVVEPLQVEPSLKMREFEGLYLAGQILGTSGYEEAAGLGLLAGTNASLHIAGEKEIILPRHKSYIGVMVDDLVHRGADEPYRLLTGRAEFRLLLREDNAWLSIVEAVPENVMKALSPQFSQVFKQWAKDINEARKFLIERGFNSNEASILQIQPGTKANIYLSRPDADWARAKSILPELENLSRAAERTLQIELKYSGYIERQNRLAEQYEKAESMLIPENFDFASIGLRREAIEKFKKFRPQNISEASGIPGIAPSDIAALVGALRKGKLAN